ncbi:MAG: hypothetical protein AAFU77_09690 [Myxococcota bacterium]
MNALRDAAKELDAEEARALEEVDDVWERLALGELSEDERAELERRRADPADDLAYSAFEPLSSDTRAAVLDQAAAAIQPTRPARREATLTRGRRWAAAAVASAVAIVLVLVNVGGGSGSLPAYELEVSGGDRLLRSAPADSGPGPVRLSSGSSFELRLIPDERVDADLDYDTRLEDSEGQAIPWEPNVELLPAGTLSVRGTVGSDFPAALGRYRVKISVRLNGERREAVAELEVMPPP